VPRRDRRHCSAQAVRPSEVDLEALHTKLAARAAGLATANSDPEAFCSTVSHDLRARLTTISGYCQVLTELCKDRLDAQTPGYLEEVREATLRMKPLIAALLYFSRSASVNLCREKFDLSALAEDVAAGLGPGERARLPCRARH